jgi:hypothetical protein
MDKGPSQFMSDDGAGYDGSMMAAPTASAATAVPGQAGQTSVGGPTAQTLVIVPRDQKEAPLRKLVCLNGAL